MPSPRKRGSHSAGTPRQFELVLPALHLESGPWLEHHLVRGFHWGPAQDASLLDTSTLAVEESTQQSAVARDLQQLEELRARWELRRSTSASLSPEVPTLLVVHALTGDARASGPGGFWEPLIGPGLPFDPTQARILCFNLLGSCYGTSGPADEGFPSLSDERALRAESESASLGSLSSTTDNSSRSPSEKSLPATITTWDQARSILMALDALGIAQVELALGGSLGGMVSLCLAALEPERFLRVAPIAASAAASPWIIGWNHIGRQAILMDPGFPHEVGRGLELARQLAMMTYRAEPGFERTQGRTRARAVPNKGTEEPSARAPRSGASWSQVAAVAPSTSEVRSTPPGLETEAPYRIQTYLEHQGKKLVRRFDARAYLALLGAMDHHDLARAPTADPAVSSARAQSWRGPGEIRASALGVSIDTDELFLPEQTERWASELERAGNLVRRVMIHSPHGHDAFLIEWGQMRAVLEEALLLQAPTTEREGARVRAPSVGALPAAPTSASLGVNASAPALEGTP